MSRKEKYFFVSLILLAIVAIFTVLYTHSGKYYYAVGEERSQRFRQLFHFMKSESACPLKSRVELVKTIINESTDDAETILLEPLI